MANMNCYSYALGMGKIPDGIAQAVPGSTAKHLGQQYLEVGNVGEKYRSGVCADLRTFNVSQQRIKCIQWGDAVTDVPKVDVGSRLIAMIYNAVGFHFYRRDVGKWTFITGMDNTVITIRESHLLGREWGLFNHVTWKRGYFIEFPYGEYGPLHTNR